MNEILDQLVSGTYCITIGNITIHYIGIKEDTAQGKREEFIIRRYINERRRNTKKDKLYDR